MSITKRSPTKFLEILPKFAYCVCAATFLAATTPAACANNYTQTLSSTVWIITSDADDEIAKGTGVYVDAEKRLVVTNAHVVGDSRTAVVFFPDVKNDRPQVKPKHYLDNITKLAQQGKVVAVDRGRDLALIQLPKTPENGTAIELADTGATAGDKIDSIGNPGASDVLWIYNSGTVRSTYNKKFKSDHGKHQFDTVEIQSPIKPGHSGGPIVNEEGKLIAIAQSFSPQDPLVSFCVDVGEIRAFIESPWKQAPFPTKELLDNASIEHKKDTTGHYEITQKLSDDRTQSVFVAKNTEYYKRADVRRVWALASVSKEAPNAELMMRLLRQSSASKIGCWAVEKNSAGEYLLIYTAKLDATAPDEALKGTIEYVAQIAGGMNKSLNPIPAKDSSEILKSWLAD